MHEFNPKELKELYIPPSASHKGQNGKLLVIGGSHLFHAASLWALEIASRIVDMVFYASVPENEKIVQDAKETFRNGIVIPRDSLEDYVEEADCILIGPGMVRASEGFKIEDLRFKNAQDIYKLRDEGEQSYYLTKYLLQKYPEKKWVIDAGALQMLNPHDLLQLAKHVIITPHPVEFARVFNSRFTIQEVRKDAETTDALATIVHKIAEEYNIVILLKGEKDIVSSPEQWTIVSGGNAGMTKGGTGDVLAGLTAALACNNDLYLAAKAASFFNKKAGESLYKRVGYYFNATDLLHEIPHIMKLYLLG